MPEIASLRAKGQVFARPCPASDNAAAGGGMRWHTPRISPRQRWSGLALALVASAVLTLGLVSGAAQAAAWPVRASAQTIPPLPYALAGYGPETLKDLTDAPPGAPKENQQAETPADPIGPPAPIDNWHAFDLAFQACLQPLEGPNGAELTLKFGLDAKGRLRGKPIASHSRMTGTPAEQRAFVADALANLARCLPLPLTPRFGPIVASRPLILRFLGPRPRERGA